MSKFWKEYQTKAFSMAVYPNSGRNIIYPALGLAGEVGEVLNKIKKIIRDDDGELTEVRSKMIAEEIGGVLWYVAAICEETGICMHDVSMQSLQIGERCHDIYSEALELQVPIGVICSCVNTPDQVHDVENIVLKANPVLGKNLATTVERSLPHVLFRLHNISWFMKIGLVDIAKKNLQILSDRQKNKTIHGDGDNR